MYADITIKSKRQQGRNFNFRTIMQAPADVRNISDFSNRLSSLNGTLNMFHMYLDIESISKSTYALDGSEEAQKKRMVDESRFAQMILESALVEREP